jgi:hypothetical protein
MPEPRHFSKRDIGAELLPMLTAGLYRDSLDALREYIQNGIDANATHITVSIDQYTVSVTDDGDGMLRQQAIRAIRLGISDKNPSVNIGFRGIGVYSAFNLCDLLEIYTKPRDGSRESKIVFNFKRIRKALLVEQQQRKRGNAPTLHLEKLLQAHVFVDDDTAGVLSTHGTKVLMSNLLPENYTRLNKWEEVEAYLQDVVPLPFRPDFTYGPTIQARFTKEDYRVVPLTLEIGERAAAIYRPYTNSLVPEGGKHAVTFFPLKKGSQAFGCAWVCINGRRVIRDPRMRGLLTKKFGFSIGNRGYLEPYFKRTVFNRRITGEIIVQHEGLVPNAARSDFENNSARQEFLEVLPSFIASLSNWADSIQQTEKAREVLGDVERELRIIADRLPQSQRDKDLMLQYNVDLAELDRRVATHKKTLQSLDDLSDDFERITSHLKACKRMVHDALATSARSRKRLEKSVVRVIQAEADLSDKPTPKGLSPMDLGTVFDAAGIRLPEEAQKAIQEFESGWLLPALGEEAYQTMIRQFQDALEEGA